LGVVPCNVAEQETPGKRKKKKFGGGTLRPVKLEKRRGKDHPPLLAKIEKRLVTGGEGGKNREKGGQGKRGGRPFHQKSIQKLDPGKTFANTEMRKFGSGKKKRLQKKSFNIAVRLVFGGNGSGSEGQRVRGPTRKIGVSTVAKKH